MEFLPGVVPYDEGARETVDENGHGHVLEDVVAQGQKVQEEDLIYSVDSCNSIVDVGQNDFMPIIV